MKTIISLLFVLFSVMSSAQDIVLSKNGIGPLPLKSGDLISVELVKKLFPEYSVNYRVGSWEGPDYHLISVMKGDGGAAFNISSYFDESNYDKSESATEFPIDKIDYISKSGITDEYGIKVGDSLDKVFRIRGENLNLIANHFDNSIGKNRIYYLFEIRPTQEEIEARYGIDYRNPTTITIEEAIKKSPIVKDIIWDRNLK